MRLTKIAFHGVPRTGTSWVGAIFDSSKNVKYCNQPLFSYAFKDYLTENSSYKVINDFFNGLENTLDNFILQKDGKEKGHIPTFLKGETTHIIYKEARYHNILENLLEKDLKLKVVGIIRDPRSVLASWYNAPKEFKKNEWDFLKEWKNAVHKNEGRAEEYYGYNKWKEVALLFLKLKSEYPDRFFLLNYSELLNDTEKVIKGLFEFCDLELSKQTIEFLRASSSKDISIDAYSVYRKNQVDDKWKTVLPEEIVVEIDLDLAGTILEPFII
jgi:hypothetical protein